MTEHVESKVAILATQGIYIYLKIRNNTWTTASMITSHTLLPMIDSAMTDNDVQRWSGYCSSLAAASTQRRPLQGIFP